MTETAYIFPGQGSQYVGMGKDLFECHAGAREMFERADDILGFSLSKICFEGPENELRKTKNTQPAIYLHSIILCSIMEPQDVGMAAGHSLGEYTALVFSGAMTFEDGLKLVRLRGELMQEAGEKELGTMAAVVGLSPDVVEKVCREARSSGVVQCANFNSPGQIVISGSVDGVRKAMEISKAQGAKLVKELVVSGAFHSPLMKSAHEGLKKALHSTSILDARIPVYSNAAAKPMQKTGEIRTLLEQQLTSAVRWEESILRMIADGARTIIEVGPGKVLQGLVKRIDPTIDVRGVDRFVDIEKFSLV
ncbi:MAG TPA: ACP S-malonyltransferase [Bacteroidota bacterium]|nr:ACP S-malonyltransferase [Bacteroidota bacterium]